MAEVVSKRAVNSKTYEIAQNTFKFVAGLSPLHLARLMILLTSHLKQLLPRLMGGKLTKRIILTR